MLVKCIINELSQIDSANARSRLEKSIHMEGPIRDLVPGQNYFVHAVECRDGAFWFFLHTVVHNDYPFPYPAEYFQILDGSIPSHWAISFNHHDDGVAFRRLSFREWADDESFYERLVEGEPEAVALFRNVETGRSS